VVLLYNKGCPEPYIYRAYTVLLEGKSQIMDIYGVYIRFWPTLHINVQLFAAFNIPCTTCCVKHTSHTHTHRHTHARTHTHTRTHKLSHTQKHTCVHTHTHKHTHARTHTHIHTHTHISTHLAPTLTCSLFPFPIMNPPLSVAQHLYPHFVHRLQPPNRPPSPHHLRPRCRRSSSSSSSFP